MFCWGWFNDMRLIIVIIENHFFPNPQIRYGKKVLRTFDVDAKGEFSENFFQPTTPSDAA
jgi:hypothetical protein